MKINLSSLKIFLSVLVIFQCSNVFAENKLTEQQALDILVAQIRKDKLYDSWTTLACLMFSAEEKTKNHFDFVIREKHGGQCPGDPNTSPIVARFRVDRMTKKIQWYEPPEGKFVPYKAVLKARLQK